MLHNFTHQIKKCANRSSAHKMQTPIVAKQTQTEMGITIQAIITICGICIFNKSLIVIMTKRRYNYPVKKDKLSPWLLSIKFVWHNQYITKISNVQYFSEKSDVYKQYMRNLFCIEILTLLFKNAIIVIWRRRLYEMSVLQKRNDLRLYSVPWRCYLDLEETAHSRTFRFSCQQAKPCQRCCR